MKIGNINEGSIAVAVLEIVENRGSQVLVRNVGIGGSGQWSVPNSLEVLGAFPPEPAYPLEGVSTTVLLAEIKRRTRG